MICFFAGFVLGEVSARVSHYMAAIGAALTVFVCFMISKKGQSRLWLALPIFFALGAVVYAMFTADREFDEAWGKLQADKYYVQAEGEVAEIKEYGEYTRLTLKNVTVCINGGWLKSRRIFVYTGRERSFDYGNMVIAEGDIREQEGVRNPGQFDYRAYYRAFDIGYAMDASFCEVTDDKKEIIHSFAEGVKKKLSERLRLITEDEDFGLLSAMLLGDKSSLDDSLRDLYQMGGIVHILTISGLHISLFGAGLYRLLRRCGGGFMASALTASITIVFYGVMTGLGTSALRAIIMYLVFLAADCLGKSYDMASACALAGLLILIEYPLVLFQFAFQMSVVCILAISMAVPLVNKYLRQESLLIKNLTAGAVIQFATLPVMLYHMYYYQALSYFVNLASLPLAGLVMMSGTLSIALTFKNALYARFCVATAHYILLIYKWLCGFAGGLKRALLVSGHISWQKTVLYYGVVLILLAYISAKCRQDKRQEGDIKKTKLVARYLLLPVVMAVNVLIIFADLDHSMKVTFLDVGQGDSIFVSTSIGETMLIDAGSSNIENVGEKIIIPALDYYGVKSLDYVFISHADSDHTNGLSALIENDRVEKIILPRLSDNSCFKEITELAAENDTEVFYINAGQRIKLAGGMITCLNPQTQASEGENTDSMVLKIETENISLLFTGDLDMEGEERVLQTANACNISLDCDILKVAHHGSKYSSGKEFLSAVTPQISVVSCSATNNYGHPSIDALERIGRAGSKIYITKDSGAVEFWVYERGYKVREYAGE